MRRWIGALGLAAVLICLLFPPWVRKLRSSNGWLPDSPLGYHLIFSPPELADARGITAPAIDMSRVALQLGAIVAATGILFLLPLDRLIRVLRAPKYPHITLQKIATFWGKWRKVVISPLLAVGLVGLVVLTMLYAMIRDYEHREKEMWRWSTSPGCATGHVRSPYYADGECLDAGFRVECPAWNLYCFYVDKDR